MENRFRPLERRFEVSRPSSTQTSRGALVIDTTRESTPAGTNDNATARVRGNIARFPNAPTPHKATTVATAPSSTYIARYAFHPAPRSNGDLLMAYLNVSSLLLPLQEGRGIHPRILGALRIYGPVCTGWICCSARYCSVMLY